jgi:Tol biopolymer transport system component
VSWDAGIGVRFEAGGPGAQLFVEPLPGGEPVSITDGCSSVDTNGIWSPDSAHVLFSGVCSGHTGYWLAGSDGKSLRAANLSSSWRTQGLTAGFDQWLVNPPRLLTLLANGDGSQVGVVPISEDGTEIAGPTEYLTFGPGAIANASASSDERIVWSAVESSSNLWRLAVDRQGHALGNPVAITTGRSACVQPVLSRDGRSVAFVELHAVHGFGHPSESELLVMNLSDRSILPVTRRSGWIGSPVFDAPGDAIVFTAMHGREIGAIQVGRRGGAEKEIIRGARRVWDLSPDGGLFLTGGPMPARWGVSVIRQGAKPVPYLTDPDRDVYNAGFSHDGRWVVFSSVQNHRRSRIYAAPLRQETVPPNDWIELTDGDKPRLSPDDRVLFFVSDRDGSRCIWRQPLTADMRPQGTAEEVFHLHSPRVPFAGADNSFVELASGPGELIFNQGETTGDIWLLDPHGRHER